MAHATKLSMAVLRPFERKVGVYTRLGIEDAVATANGQEPTL
jgi:hypothetical protein